MKSIYKNFFYALSTCIIYYLILYFLIIEGDTFFYRNQTLGKYITSYVNQFEDMFLVFFPIFITYIGKNIFYKQYKSKNLKNIIFRQTKSEYIIDNYKKIAYNVITFCIFYGLINFVVFTFLGKNIDLSIPYYEYKRYTNVAYGFLWYISPILFYLAYILNLILWGISFNFIGLLSVIYFKKGFLYHIVPIISFIVSSIIFGVLSPAIAPQNLLAISNNMFAKGYFSIIETVLIITISLYLGYNYFTKKESSID